MTFRKIKLLILICTFTSFTGIVYQRVDDGFVDYNGILYGLAIGLCFGLFELFLFPKTNQRVRKLPFLGVIGVKTLFYTLITFLVPMITSLILGFFIGESIDALYQWFSQDYLTIVLYALLIYAPLIFFLQLNSLLGEGVLLKYLTGKYHQPTEEYRIFMFLDLKSSTTIAEQLGHNRFYALLNDFFFEISEPVQLTKAEIYQYVGDEVVFTWKLKEGLKDANCLRIYTMIRNQVHSKEKAYLTKHGIVPDFKAGVHCGKVISAQIGDLKKEIIYNGDVLNTTSRIQDQCNQLNCELLVSSDLLSQISLPVGYLSQEIGPIKLRGKENETLLYCVKEVSQEILGDEETGRRVRAVG